MFRGLVLKSYLLDTNMVGYYFGQHPNVMARVQALPDQSTLHISVVTHGEIAFGHEITESTDHQARIDCDTFVNNEFPLPIPVTRHTRMHYGMLKARLFRAFPPQHPRRNHPERCFDRVTGAELGIDENDLWIAAQAIERGMVLVTNDEMLRIREIARALDVEDWTQPV